MCCNTAQFKLIKYDVTIYYDNVYYLIMLYSYTMHIKLHEL